MDFIRPNLCSSGLNYAMTVWTFPIGMVRLLLPCHSFSRYFRHIWLAEFSHLQCDIDRGCDECDSLNQNMRNAKSDIVARYVVATLVPFGSLIRTSYKAQLEEHTKHYTNIINWFDLELHDAHSHQNITGNLFIWADEMGIHYLPASKQSLPEFKCLSGHGVLGLHFNGITNGSDETSGTFF